MYHSYLLLHSQLLFQKKAKIMIDNHEIFVENDRNKWKLSAKVFSELPSHMRELGKRYQLQSHSIYLNTQEDSVFLVQETKPLSDYIPFARFMRDYLMQLNAWSNE